MSLDPIPTTFAEMQEAYHRTIRERDALQREVVRLRDQLSRATWQADVLLGERAEREALERGASGTFG